MSMNPEQDDFPQLRRLLALKRHEQPPPGYFDGFSRQIIVRLRAGERLQAPSLSERLFSQAPWLERLWLGLPAKPALAGAFGVLVCGLVISSAIFSEHPELPQVSVLSATTAAAPAAQPLMTSQLVPVDDNSAQASSVTGVANLPRTDSLFNEIDQLRHTPEWRLQSGFPAGAEPVSERIPIGQ